MSGNRRGWGDPFAEMGGFFDSFFGGPAFGRRARPGERAPRDADPATARVIHVEGAEASGGAAASRDTSASRLPLHARVAELDDEDAEVGSARESTYPSSQPDSVEEPASEAEEAEEQGRRRVHVHRPTAGRGEGGGAPRRVKVAGGERRPGGGEPLEEAVPRGNAMKRHPHSQRRE